MNCFLLVLFVALVSHQATQIQARQVSDVTRKIHGSYGDFRDFTAEDCTKPHESKWERCVGTDNSVFVYHWNNQLKGCERAIFKGCGATRNNFLTERDCNNQAKPVCTK